MLKLLKSTKIATPKPVIAATSTKDLLNLSNLNLHGLTNPKVLPNQQPEKFNLFMQLLRSGKRTRLQLETQRIYFKTDALTPSILDFFYKDLALKKNFQSWFSVTQLHIWMLQSRVRLEGKEGKQWNSALIDHFSSDIELKIKLMGIDHPKIHDRYLHELLSFHYGCVLAYDEGFESSDCLLTSALWRNLFVMEEEMEMQRLEKVVYYVRSQMHRLHQMKLEDFYQNKFNFEVPKHIK